MTCACREFFTDAIGRLVCAHGLPADALARWTSSERNQATQWAMHRQKELIHALKPEEQLPDRVPAEPPCILRDATLPLVESTR